MFDVDDSIMAFAQFKVDLIENFGSFRELAYSKGGLPPSDSADHNQALSKFLEPLRFKFCQHSLVALELEDIICHICAYYKPSIIHLVGYLENVFHHSIYHSHMTIYEKYVNEGHMLSQVDKRFYYCASMIELIKIKWYQSFLRNIGDSIPALKIAVEIDMSRAFRMLVYLRNHVCKIALSRVQRPSDQCKKEKINTLEWVHIQNAMAALLQSDGYCYS